MRDAIIENMANESESNIKTGGSSDIAFAIVALASYFAMFSELKSSSVLSLILLIILGITYITVGIYGYSFVIKKNEFSLFIAYFIFQIILGGEIIYLGHASGFNAMLLMPLASQAVVLFKDNFVYLINTLIVITYLIAVRAFSASWINVWSNFPSFLAGLVFIVIFTQMVVQEEKARKEVERLLGELAEANENLRNYSVQIEELAIAKERNRLAREIHDGLGHYLTTINMQIKAAKAVMKINPQKAQEALDTALAQSHEALLDVRKSVAALRILPEEELPLPKLIMNMLKTCESTGIKTSFNLIGNEFEISPQSQLAVYRTVQEGINNTCKHAKAKHLWVSLNYSDAQRIKLQIKDDGIGSEKINGGFGLIGIKERANVLNGKLEIKSNVGQGFSLELELPR